MVCDGVLNGEESSHPGYPFPGGSSGANLRPLFGTLLSAAHQFNKAADLYSQALEHNPFDATLWCNRAYTRIKLEEHGYALSDAGEAFPPARDIDACDYRC